MWVLVYASAAPLLSPLPTIGPGLAEEDGQVLGPPHAHGGCGRSFWLLPGPTLAALAI